MRKAKKRRGEDRRGEGLEEMRGKERRKRTMVREKREEANYNGD